VVIGSAVLGKPVSAGGTGASIGMTRKLRSGQLHAFEAGTKTTSVPSRWVSLPLLQGPA
jgi:hypothetical protein